MIFVAFLKEVMGVKKIVAVARCSAKGIVVVAHNHSAQDCKKTKPVAEWDQKMAETRTYRSMEHERRGPMRKPYVDLTPFDFPNGGL
jgi:hypothetical protein